MRAAVPLLDDALFAALSAAQGEVERVAETGDVAAANRRFHFTLFETAVMPRLARIIGTL